MSNQSYTKGCRDRGQQIRMAEVNGKSGSVRVEWKHIPYL